MARPRAFVASLLMGLSLVPCVVGCGNGPSTPPNQSSPSTPSFRLYVENIDDPPVAVKVNDRVVVAKAVCQLELGLRSPVAVLTPGPDLPLPWEVEVVKSDGSAMGSWTESGVDGDRQIVIRGNEAWEAPFDQPQGPMSTSCAGR